MQYVCSIYSTVCIRICLRPVVFIAAATLLCFCASSRSFLGSCWRCFRQHNRHHRRRTPLTVTQWQYFVGKVLFRLNNDSQLKVITFFGQYFPYSQIHFLARLPFATFPIPPTLARIIHGLGSAFSALHAFPMKNGEIMNFASDTVQVKWNDISWFKGISARPLHATAHHSCANAFEFGIGGGFMNLQLQHNTSACIRQPFNTESGEIYETFRLLLYGFVCRANSNECLSSKRCIMWPLLCFALPFLRAHNLSRM